MAVRQMEAADLDSVRALTGQLGYESPAAMQDDFARIARDPEHLALVAVEGPRVVGWLHAYRVHLLHLERSVEIGALVVDEASRGKGVGRTLMQAAERWARTAGYGQIRVRSRLSRDGAHRFYVRLGYAKEKTQYTFARRLD